MNVSSSYLVFKQSELVNGPVIHLNCVTILCRVGRLAAELVYVSVCKVAQHVGFGNTMAAVVDQIEDDLHVI